MKNILSSSVTAVVVALLCFNASYAKITLPDVIGDAMVLQRDSAVPIWGQADPREVITVRFGKQVKKATADSNGRWRVNLDPLRANASPETMTISGSNTIESSTAYAVTQFQGTLGRAVGALVLC